MMKFRISRGSRLTPVKASLRSKPAAPQPVLTPDEARHSTFDSLSDLRTTVDLLRSKLGELEDVLATAFTGGSQGSDAVRILSCQPSAGNLSTPSRPPLAESASPTSYSRRDETFEDPKWLPNQARANADDHSVSETEQQAAEELEASVVSSYRTDTVTGKLLTWPGLAQALEFLALGRQRNFGVVLASSDSLDRLPIDRHGESNLVAGSPSSHGQQASTAFTPSASQTFPTLESIAQALPSREVVDAVVVHSCDWLGWHHGAIHSPTFMRELGKFWGWGDRRLESCNPAWLALLFAVMVVGVGNLAPGQSEQLGIAQGQESQLARKWFDVSLACLYRANFLQNHTIFGVQAICILVVSGQDAAGPNLIPTLLATAISSCQELGLHRMVSDAEWEKSVRKRPPEVRAFSLIDREVKKRIFWSLVTQDWFGTSYRRTYIVQPTQVLTPLPLNARDEDLFTGQLVNRPASSYTVCSKLLLWIQIARCLQSAFEHIDANAVPSYDVLLAIDERLSSILSHAPPFLYPDGPSEGMPPQCFEWIRTTFIISSSHKVLSLHRPFLHLAFQDPRYNSSRRRALQASRTILKEAKRCGSTIFRLWTVPYHITAASCVVLLDLFQRIGSNSPELDQERSEVQGALSTLEAMQSTSSVAGRGVALVQNLIDEEERLRQEKSALARSALSRERKKRSREESADGEYTSAAKRITLSDVGSSNSNVSTPSDHHPSPRRMSSPTFTFKTPRLPTHTSVHASGTHPIPNHTDLLTMTPSASSFDLPAEFMNVFLDSGLGDLGLGLSNVDMSTTSNSMTFLDPDSLNGGQEAASHSIDSHFLGDLNGSTVNWFT